MSGDLTRPDSREPGPRVVEGEIVGGKEGRARLRGGSRLERLAARAGLSVILGLIAVALIAAGVLLTATIVGAVVGVPLALLGLAIGAAAAWILVGGGTMSFHVGTIGKMKGGGEDENGD
ncbi:MAG: hypothetical protein KGL04_06745 [Elusimicrobia bacterium]|nr:hypothetical protein [Elusimicrobiota bacterium]MDE2313854.1 hypothetical protein [Elusimicrobiota bacterium]